MASLKGKYMKIKLVIRRKRKKSKPTGSFLAENKTKHFSQNNGTRNDFLTWYQLEDHIKIHIKIKFYVPALVTQNENCSNKEFIFLVRVFPVFG